jgi:GntR family transcriptional regulator, transcriptional repressor for pyruvate dehydrogenase complex
MTRDADASRVLFNMPGKVHVPKTAELVASELRRRIVRGDLMEGDALPHEDALLEQFGVSRPTLREVLRVLESEQLIRVGRGSNGGARVQAPDGDVAARYAGRVLEYRDTTLADVFDAAAVLEAPLVGRLAKRRTAADLKKLRAAVDWEESAGSASQVAVERDVDFHHLIIELAGNATLQVLVDILRRIIDTATLRALGGSTPRDIVHAHKGALSTHRRLIELLEARDVTAAEELWHRHVTEGGRIVLRELGSPTVLDLMD